MHLGIARLLLIASAVRVLAGCSLQEATAAPGGAKTQAGPRERAPSVEEDESDRRRRQMQSELLSDLQQLRDSQTTEPTEQARHDGANPKLLIFGGASHEIYLGCLCEGKNPESVFNLTGEYGSDLSSTSLRNRHAPFGSTRGDTSACNAKAAHPPSVVASDGKALGLLTMNPSLKRRIVAPSVTNWLSRVCRL